MLIHLLAIFSRSVFLLFIQEYLTSDGETVWKFHEDGRKKEMVTPEEPMDRIIFASQTNQYVGWQHKDDTLFVSEFQCFGFAATLHYEGKFGSGTVLQSNVGFNCMKVSLGA